MKTNEPIQQKEPSGASSFISGILLGIVPLVLVISFCSSTVVIAKNPLASWLVDGWVLVGTLFLFFKSKELTTSNRSVVEGTLVLAAAALFITKFFFTGVPDSNSSQFHQSDWVRVVGTGLFIVLAVIFCFFLSRKKR